MGISNVLENGNLLAEIFFTSFRKKNIGYLNCSTQSNDFSVAHFPLILSNYYFGLGID